MYTFKPKKFYLITLLLTWILWITAAVLSKIAGGTENAYYASAMILMFLGLIIPSVMAFVFVKKSGSEVLKQDYKEKILGFFRIKPKNVLLSCAVFGFLWGLWHLPLFFIEGTYQAEILAMNPLKISA